MNLIYINNICHNYFKKNKPKLIEIMMTNEYFILENQRKKEINKISLNIINRFIFRKICRSDNAIPH